tara:strand:- start:51 stop:314 length:264 start_codon:yes stop_codon:yes gene_type:complete
MTDEEKTELIKKLSDELETKKGSNLEKGIRLMKEAAPGITDEEAKERAIILNDKMAEHIKKSDAQSKSLDECKTMEDVKAWRLKTGL